MLPHPRRVRRVLPTALTVGNFDGNSTAATRPLLRACSRALFARAAGVRVSFEPHPLHNILRPSGRAHALTSLRDSEARAARGARRTSAPHVQRFDRAFASLAPEAFSRQVLAKRLKARWLLIGGIFASAQSAPAMSRFEESRPPVRLRGRNPAVVAQAGCGCAGELGGARGARRGDLDAPKASSAGPTAISGRVVHGRKLGRELGYATANVQLSNRPPLRASTRCAFTASARARARASRARRAATIHGERALGARSAPVRFLADLYGAHMRVEFLHKIRDEAKYSDLDALKAQIGRDCDAARSSCWKAEMSEKKKRHYRSTSTARYPRGGFLDARRTWPSASREWVKEWQDRQGLRKIRAPAAGRPKSCSTTGARHGDIHIGGCNRS